MFVSIKLKMFWQRRSGFGVIKASSKEILSNPNKRWRPRISRQTALSKWIAVSLIWELQWLIGTKHFPESKNTFQNPKHVPESKNTSQNPKHVPESKNTFSLSKEPTFRYATTGFPAKWHLENECRNSILMTCHYPDLGSASDWLNKINCMTEGEKQDLLAD